MSKGGEPAPTAKIFASIEKRTPATTTTPCSAMTFTMFEEDWCLVGAELDGSDCNRWKGGRFSSEVLVLCMFSYACPTSCDIQCTRYGYDILGTEKPVGKLVVSSNFAYTPPPHI